MTVELIPYLIMDGNAKEAMKFYEEAIDGKVLFSQSYGEFHENPEEASEETKDLVMHATMQIGKSVLMFSDTYPGYKVQSGNQVTICISTKEIEQSKRIFEALSVGGEVEMPLQNTGFSPAYGKVVDKYGVLFQVYTEGNPEN